MANYNENGPQIPIFKIEQIVNVLASFNIKVTVNELKRPSPEVVANIYKAFLIQFMNVTIDQIHQEQQDLALHFEEDVIKFQSDCFKNLQFYIMMQYWNDICGLELPFLKIFHPTKQEFLTQASAMIAFCKFEFNELNDFQTVVERSKVYSAQCDAVKQESEKLASKIFSINSDLNQVKPLVEKCNLRSKDLKEKIAALEEARKKQDEEKYLLSKDYLTLEAENKETMSRHQVITNKLALYAKLIIRSPERLSSDMVKNELRVSELEKLISQIKEEIEEVKINIFEREKFIESYENICDILVNLLEMHVFKANAKNKEIESFKEEITNLNFKSEQSASQNASLAASHDRIKALIDKYKEKIGKEMDVLEETYNRIRQDTSNAHKEIEELSLKIETLIKEKNEFTRQTKEITDKGIETLNYYDNTEQIYSANGASKLEQLERMNKAINSKFESIRARLKRSEDMQSEFIDSILNQ